MAGAMPRLCRISFSSAISSSSMCLAPGMVARRGFGIDIGGVHPTGAGDHHTAAHPFGGWQRRRLESGHGPVGGDQLIGARIPM